MEKENKYIATTVECVYIIFISFSRHRFSLSRQRFDPNSDFNFIISFSLQCTYNLEVSLQTDTTVRDRYRE